MSKIIILLLTCSCTMIASIPFPESQKSIVDSSLLNEDSLNNEVIGSDIRRFGEFNVQQEDAFNTGNVKRNGLESETLINGNNSPLSRPSLHHIGSEEAAVRAANTPLFFGSFDHGHMMLNYAEQRERDGFRMRFRSIRPGFPWSDVNGGREKRFVVGL